MGVEEREVEWEAGMHGGSDTELCMYVDAELMLVSYTSLTR